MKKLFAVLFYLFFAINLFSQFRTFNSIFPGINQQIRDMAFSETGFIISFQRTGDTTLLGQGSSLDPQILNTVLSANPGYIVESILVIPGAPGSVSLLDVYNAIGNIQRLRGRLYSSYTQGRPVPLFEEATRIRGERQTSAVPDPSPASVLPQSETVYIRLKDNNFGNTYYRGEMALVQSGLRYTLTNFRNITYLLVPVIREGKFIAQLYFEPIQEGLLVYSLAGADVSDFVASRISISSAISKRLAVITAWAADGITGQTR
jgi:hypothetical protein